MPSSPPAAEKDQADPLAELRDAFVLPAGLCYLNGNSLGPLPRTSAKRLDTELHEHWGQALVGAWNSAGWIDLPIQLGNKLGGLLGAAEGQTLVADSTSINLFKLLHAALQRHPQRRLVVLEHDAFPTDNYIAQGRRQLRPDLELHYLAADELMDALAGSDVAAALLGHVNYRSGRRLDLPALQRQAHTQDTPIVWDLAHSIGALPLALDAWEVDYAVGCSYKFLNGGPGAPAFSYVARRRQADLKLLLQGWLGHHRPFAFEPEYRPAENIRRLQVGTPSILSMASLDAALDVFAKTTVEKLWDKSCRLFDDFQTGLQNRPELADFELMTPADPAHRGSQLSLAHPHAHAICRALAEAGVIADYREPAILRFGLTPLYTRFSEIDRALNTLCDIMRDDRWGAPEYQQQQKVT